MFVFSQLFLYKPIFMTELLLAEALFFFKLKKRKGFLWRSALSIACCYGFAVAMPIVFDEPAWCSFLFFTMYMISAIAYWFVFDVSIISVLFCSVSGYTVQHISFQLYDCLSKAFGFHGDIYTNIATTTTYQPFTQPQTALMYLFSFIIVYGTTYLLFGSRIEKGGEIQLKSNAVMMLVCICVLTDILLSSYVTYFKPAVIEYFYIIIIDVLSILFCLMTMCFQFELLTRKKLEQEINVINSMLDKEREHYEAVRENIHAVNQKCHDLKYKIRQIGGNTGVDKDTLSEMENVVNLYESYMQTGNEALDIILTEKKLYCQKNGIELSCIADGAKLAFMKDADIYVLFGNAIDNAIEAVNAMVPEKRVIGVRVQAVKGFLTIKIHNYYDGTLVFDDGIPLTTKTDKLSHGFGIPSMKVICQRYDGDMRLSVENNIFELSFLFAV